MFLWQFSVSRMGQKVMDMALPHRSLKLNEITEIYDYNIKDWGPALLKTIPRDQLPLQFGIKRNSNGSMSK